MQVNHGRVRRSHGRPVCNTSGVCKSRTPRSFSRLLRARLYARASSVILSYGGLYHQFRRPGSGAVSTIGTARIYLAYLHETYNPRSPITVLHSSSTLTATRHPRQSRQPFRNASRDVTVIRDDLNEERKCKSRVMSDFVLVTPNSGLAELNR